MNMPTPRFTGIFIPIEILQREDIGALDKILLSWIDALFCKERKGCFASNEYLAKRLNVEENTIAKTLTKLRKLNLIEDVSFDGRTRVIRALINKCVEEAQSNPALDLNPIAIGKKSNPGLEKNPSYPYTESKAESKVIDIGATPPAAPSPIPSSFFKRAEYVAVSNEDHAKLVAAHGEDFTARCYKALSDWKIDTPRAKWKKSDYRSILRWVVDKVREDELKGKKTPLPKPVGELNQETQAHIKRICDRLDSALTARATAQTFFYARGDHALMVNKHKDFEKTYYYASFALEQFKEIILQDLDICFPGARQHLFPNTDYKVKNLIRPMLEKSKLGNGG